MLKHVGVCMLNPQDENYGDKLEIAVKVHKLVNFIHGSSKINSEHTDLLRNTCLELQRQIFNIGTKDDVTVVNANFEKVMSYIKKIGTHNDDITTVYKQFVSIKKDVAALGVNLSNLKNEVGTIAVKLANTQESLAHAESSIVNLFFNSKLTQDDVDLVRRDVVSVRGDVDAAKTGLKLAGAAIDKLDDLLKEQQEKLQRNKDHLRLHIGKNKHKPKL